MTRIVVGIDGGATSKIAAERSIGLALRLDAEVHFVTVVTAPDDGKVGANAIAWHIHSLDQAKAHVDEFLDELGRDFVPHTVAALSGQPAQALVDEALRLDADLIVIGNADIQRLSPFVESVAGGIAMKAPCDVLIVNTTEAES